MWPFGKKNREKVERIHPDELNFTQLDVTERFGDHLTLSREEWVETIPLNSLVKEKPGNLPPINANAEEVYRTASNLSLIRERFQVPDDGVYCPVCHIANIDIVKLHTPCPKCERPLLAFGWN